MNRSRTVWLTGLACLAAMAFTSAVLAQGTPAYLKLSVPATAVVEIEGVKTTQTGEVRRFVSPPLAAGKNYTYTVKVTWKDADGKEQKKEETVKVQPGETAVVDLRPTAAAAKEEPKPVAKEEKPAAKEEPKPVAKEEKPAAKEEKPAAKEEKPAAKEDDKKPVAEQKEEKKTPDVIYVPTPHAVVKRMLELAKVTDKDVVYDLGCGDARIVVTAAKDFGVKKAMGFDIDPERIKDSNENVKKNNVGDKVTIVKKDIFTQDLSEANVVTLYLLPTLNVKLIPQLEKLKPGSRIVSHDFDMEGVKPDVVEDIEAADDNGNKRNHKIYLWTVPLKKEK